VDPDTADQIAADPCIFGSGSRSPTLKKPDPPATLQDILIFSHLLSLMTLLTNHLQQQKTLVGGQCEKSKCKQILYSQDSFTAGNEEGIFLLELCENSVNCRFFAHVPGL
jgi:hypothetical protein